MTGMRRFSARRWGILLAAMAIAVLLGVLWLGGRPHELQPRAAGDRPKLMLLTSLPLIFPEEFALEGGGSQALEALERRYTVVPIATTNSASLKQARLLVMAHPLAQPAESLVDLDRWVRGGGRLLLLADPRLDWPSSRPLGDKLRPPPSFADTGLLAHWGLTLATGEVNGEVTADIGSDRVMFFSPGELTSDGRCRLSGRGIIVRCQVGRGRATVIADADWLNVEEMRGVDREENLGLLLGELAALER